jgi:molecular chaperone DnaK
VYSTEKSLKEYGGDLDAGVKDNIDDALKKSKEALEGQDAQAMRTAAEQLSQSSHKLAEAMYAKASRQQAGEEASGDAKEQSPSDGKKKKDDVVDADFEEVKD